MESLYFGVFMYAMSGLMLLARFTVTISSRLLWRAMWCGCVGGALVLTWCVIKDLSYVVVPLAASVVFGAMVSVFLRRYTEFGVCFLSSVFCFHLSFVFGVRDILIQFEWSVLMVVIGYCGMGLCVLMTASNALWAGMVDLPEYSMKFPKRERAYEHMARNSECRPYPKVSVHVPCYQEPPDVVIATLNALSRMDYADFEVIVVDNNTKDAAIWRPVQSHCVALGSKFKFFHVDPLSGAKAGAMNFAFKQSDPQSTIIAAVDADYQADVMFLKKLVCLFDDENVAYVQTSHDYRTWSDNPFLSSIYYFYLPWQKIVQPAINEFNAANLVGTMCLVRRTMLEEVGGWAEWSLTEDDELSVRLLAKGYTGHVLADTFGKGLIPETFEGIKKQLFRWMAGPVQEFRVNWRLHLGIESNCKFTRAQRALRLKRMLNRVASGLFFLPVTFALMLSTYLIVNDMKLAVPGSMLLFLVVGMMMSYLRLWIVIRRLGGRRLKDFMLTVMLEGALRWNLAVAFFVPLFKLNMPWVKTDKFRKAGSLARAFNAAKTETLIGLLHFVAAFVLLHYADFKAFDIVAVVFMLTLLEGFAFTGALVVAIISERSLANDSSAYSLSENSKAVTKL